MVDLYSQREAVRKYVQGWRLASIVDWMGQFGTVESLPTFGEDGLYVFRSKWGALKTSFYLTEEYGMVVMAPGQFTSPQPC